MVELIKDDKLIDFTRSKEKEFTKMSKIDTPSHAIHIIGVILIFLEEMKSH